MSIVERALERAKAEAAEGERAPRAVAGAPRPTSAKAPERNAAEPNRAPVERTARTVLGRAKTVHIDVEGLRAVGTLPPLEEERVVGNQFRAIKRPLIEFAFRAAATEGESRTSGREILVCSALPGDGKTYTAINLAFSIARERDCSVLLVDGDGAKRDASRLFGLDDAPGLIDALSHPEKDIESLISPTDVAGLSILPAGARSEWATELYASQRMQELLDELALLDPRCVIILDSPPILLTNEAQVLASLFGQVVVVVRAGSTPQPAVLEALRVIGTSARVRMILNQVEAGGVGGYHYGSAYGSVYHAVPEQGADDT